MSDQKLAEGGDGIAIELEQGKVCKHSIRYEAKDPEAPVANIYIAKKVLGDPAPKAVLVQVSVRGA